MTTLSLEAQKTASLDLKMTEGQVRSLAIDLLELHENVPNNMTLIANMEGWTEASPTTDLDFHNEEDYIKITSNHYGSFWDKEDVPSVQQIVEELRGDILEDYIIEIENFMNKGEGSEEARN